MISIQKKTIRSTLASLLNWFELNQRDLPWRGHANSYTVWISEIMLQQTVTKAVIRHFTRWMGEYPNLISLSVSNENDVLQQWEGLGYYSRARNILKTARIVVAHHGGIQSWTPTFAG
jgi:A/G-specific adenine glycosylase